MKPILERLKAGEVIVADGGMGTMLFKKGLASGDCPEALNFDSPDILKEIAAEYYEAGAEIIQTNTFGGSPLKLAEYDLDSKTKEINTAAVNIVKSAVNGGAYISGSCGPSGKILEPYGDQNPEGLKESFNAQSKALIEAGVDLICVETMIDINEAKLAIEAVRENSADIPIMASMTFDSTPRGYFTIMGTSVEQAVSELKKAGANIVGSNCGNGFDVMIGIAKEFKKYSDLPILIQSNAGLPEAKAGQLHYPESPAFFAEKAEELIDVGVSIIGGCCGTTPEHISAIKAAVAKKTS